MAIYFLRIQPSHHHHLSVAFKYQGIASPAIPLLTLQLGSRYFLLLVRYRKSLIS
jgi:hypothetical protein